MFTSPTQIVGGDVVSFGASIFVVHEILDDEVILLRLESQRAARHRADVVLEHWSDMTSSGLPLQDMVIRCVPIRRRGAANLTRLGVLPECLRTKVLQALNRERQIRRFEGSPTVQSNLLASTTSRGRRVNAVRYA